MEKEWWTLSKADVLKELKTSEKGLNEKEAKERLEKYGKNELRQLNKVHPIWIFLEQFKSVFILILFLAAAFSFFIGHYVDFGVIIAIIMINSVIGFYQQYKAEKIISEMKKMLVPKVKIIREDKLEEIEAIEIVPGDILILSEGDKIMADCRIIESNMLETNEAILTGESFPQAKSAEIMKLDTELANRENMLYMGTTIAKGNGKAIVVSTGMETEFGKIARIAQKLKHEKTPLESKLDNFSEKIAIVVIILAAITIGFGLFRGEAWGEMILTGVALAVSVIPEGVPAVIAITLAFAIKRMQKQNVLVRKLPAGETLGRVSVICTDKTGTLTEEEMHVVRLYSGRKYFEIKDGMFYDYRDKINPLDNNELKELLKVGIMCNNARIEKDGNVRVFGDPTEKALVLSADNAGLLKKDETEKEKRIIEYSFSSKRKMMSIVRKTNGNYTSYVKGAPDVILERCEKELFNGRVIGLTTKRRKEILAIQNEMSSNALRVLGFAFKTINKVSQDEAEKGLVFIGFQGMMDPPRKEVAQAIEECKLAGIKVKMITGDSLLTAVAVGKKINLDGEIIEEKELEKLSEEDFYKVVEQKNIFARITPEMKLKIIHALNMQGEIVAVTGDGVNDVLALKEAHIGVAMGIRGSDVTREAADIILLDDNFASVVQAVKEGRRVYANMKKSITAHVTANADEMFVVLFALLFAWPIPMMPLAILWMNLITDSLPTLALGFEPLDKDAMRKKPIARNETILTGIGTFLSIAGILSFIITIGLFALFFKEDLEKARTIAITTAVFCEMFIIISCRSERNLWEIGLFSNKFLVYSVLAAIGIQLFAIYFTPLAGLFGFVPLSFSNISLIFCSSIVILIFFEAKKWIKHW